MFSQKLIDFFTKGLLPYHCILCENVSTRTQDLCEPCYQELPFSTHACPCCGQVFFQNIVNSVCGGCLTKPPPFEKTFALFTYIPPITQLLMNLKFHQALINARVFGELLGRQIQQKWYQYNTLPEVILPVPLHATRLKQRGFNQAIELARPIAQKLKLALDYKSCIRVKNTDSQAMLMADDRILNVKDAFKLANPIHYKHVAVIDDVITTGHTIRSFCQLLKQAGVIQIDVWCCARAQL
jgi:ComF family protein